jgi:hypothetical protein
VFQTKKLKQIIDRSALSGEKVQEKGGGLEDEQGIQGERGWLVVYSAGGGGWFESRIWSCQASLSEVVSRRMTRRISAKERSSLQTVLVGTHKGMERLVAVPTSLLGSPLARSETSGAVFVAICICRLCILQARSKVFVN